MEEEKNKQKVYLVVEQYTFECVTETKVSVYSTKEKALADLTYKVEREKADSWINELKHVNEEWNDDMTSYNAWLDGRAAEYETVISVQEKEVW